MHRFYPPETRLFKSLADLKLAHFDYDCMIVGSDQVWNPQISKDKCLAYFLDFGGENVLRVSYASSFGISKWPVDNKLLTDKVAFALSRFNALSVREKIGQSILKNIFQLNSTLVVDPTMLHSNYEEITGPIHNNGQVIAYLLNRTPKQLSQVIKLSRVLGTRPKMISTIHFYKGFKYTYPPSIDSWIRNIAGADYVITDSFHGAVFSLIYRKQFVVITPENGRNSGLQDLMKLAGIGRKYFLEDDVVDFNEIVNDKINYFTVEKLLKAAVDKSWGFLKKALG